MKDMMDLIGCEVRMFHVRDGNTFWWIEVKNREGKVFRLEPVSTNHETGDLTHIRVKEVKP